jgi:type IV pilus assembly protein PilB
MIGEIRDSETAQIAVRASITGHLVLSTIHTNSSLNTIERLLDMDVERYLLSSALTGVISQKLARRLCKKCRRIRPTTEYEKKLFREVMHQQINEIYTNVGCDECNNGYKGRIAIHEVLLVTQEIRDAISNNIRKEDLRNLVYTSDVTTLLQDGMNKVLIGETTIEEVLKLIELENDDTPKEDKVGLAKSIDYSNMSRDNILKQTVPFNETKPAPHLDNDIVRDVSSNEFNDFDINLDI